MSTVAIPSAVKKDATVISLVGFAHGTSHFFHLMLPPLFPWFMREYSLSYTQTGALMTVFFITSLVTLWWRRRDLSGALDAPAADYEKSKKRTGNVGLFGLLRLRLTWFAFGFFFFSTLVLGALENFAPSLLRDLYGLSLAAATSGLTAYLVGGAAGLALGGFLVRAGKGQEKLVGLCFFSSASLALLLALAVAPMWSVVGLMGAMGFGVGVAGPSRDMLVRKSTVEQVGKGAFGRIYGLVYSGADVGLATAPLIFGMLMDARKPHFVFAGISIALVISIAAAQAIALEARQVATGP